MDEDLLEEFIIGTFLFGDRLDDIHIIRLAEQKIAGNEIAYCTYEEDDEDYKEGYVSVLLFKPFIEDDVVLHIENKVFFDRLISVLRKKVADKEELTKVEKYLLQIKPYYRR